MKTKILIRSMIIFMGVTSLSSCKKEDPDETSYEIDMTHLMAKWKVDEAFKNSTGLESDNQEDVTFDWTNWNIEFWNNNTYKIIEFSPDSTSSIIDSGSWQIDLDNYIFMRGTISLIDFETGNIIDDGDSEKSWLKKKNENNQVWIWIENSYYGSTGVFLKLIPY